MLSYLTCVLIYSSTKYALEHILRGGCSENFVIFAEKYLQHSLMLRNLKYEGSAHSYLNQSEVDASKNIR